MAENEQDILEVVDEFADALDPPRVEEEARRLGLTLDELLARIAVEVKVRQE